MREDVKNAWPLAYDKNRNELSFHSVIFLLFKKTAGYIIQSERSKVSVILHVFYEFVIIARL